MVRHVGTYFLIFIFGLSGIQCLSIALQDEYEDRLANDLLFYLDTGNKTSFLQDNLQYARIPLDERWKDIQDIPDHVRAPSCRTCRIGIGILISIVRSGASDAEFYRKSISLCNILGFGEGVVCRNMIQFNARQVIYIFRNTERISAEIVCGSLYQGSCTYVDPLRDWSIEIDAGGPEIQGPKDNIPNETDELTVVHITDTHYDPEYEVGTDTQCNYPLCCRSHQGFPTNPEYGAGKWGDYRVCDMPWNSIENVFAQVERNHKKIDLIYVTGDYIDHAVWDTSFVKNSENIKKTFEALRNQFPNVPIYPTVGNHEPHPLNLFSPNHVTDREIGTRPLYEFLAKTWSFLPNTTYDTIIKGGYYTVLVRPGFRIVSINNNLCINFNFWNLHDTKYMAEHLQWLHDTLLKAEADNEKVHILGHMVLGASDCINNFAREYRRVVDRFWNTISAQFVGHSHKDEVHIYYSREHPSHAINVAWNGGSATTYRFVNPNYRIYSVEKQTYQVTDHETWIYNLTEANLGTGPPRWFKEYSFKDAYGVENMSPASLDRLAHRFAEDEPLLRKYWQHFVKMGDHELRNGCDRNCLTGKLCRMVTNEFFDQRKCNELTKKMIENQLKIN